MRNKKRVLLLEVLVIVILSFFVIDAAHSLPAAGQLLQRTDLVYQGSFRVSSAFSYGGDILAWNPVRNTLLLGGNNFGEVSVPALKTGAVTTLNTATTVTAPFDPFEGKRNQVKAGTPEQTIMGGVWVESDKLYMDSWIYYDANHNQNTSHFVRPLDFSIRGQVQGPFATIATVYEPGSSTPLPHKQAYVSGYFAAIPPEWQARLGGRVMNGLCCTPIISRTSSGASAWVIDPAQIDVVNPIPVTPLVYYPINHVIAGGGWRSSDSTYYNGGGSMGSAIWPGGTDSILFFGSTGLGEFCYGAGTTDPALHGKFVGNSTVDIYCYDPTNPYKSQHTYPYVSRIWAYDANDFLAVKNGAKQPWDLLPYTYWDLTFPAAHPQSPAAVQGFKGMGGVTYDPATGRIFVAQIKADTPQSYNFPPVIHVYTIGSQSNLTLDTTPPIISNVQASNIGQFSADISWNTNEPSDTQVEYGTTTTYGSSTTINAALVSFHSATLSGLSANTLYHYRVKSRDAAGNLATSPDASFTTKAAPGNTITLNPAITYQTMSGWEEAGLNTVHDYFGWLPYTNTLHDLSVNDLGLNRISIGVDPAIEHPQDCEKNYLDGIINEGTFVSQCAYISQNDNSDPNIVNPNGFHFTLLDWQIDNLVLPAKLRLEARGERLYVTIRYVDFGTSPFEHANNPAEYAEFMLVVFDHVKNKYSFIPDGIEIINEPDNTWEWTPAAIGNAVAQTGARLAAAGYRPDFIVPGTVNKASAVPFFDQIVAVPNASQYIKEISWHCYSDSGTNSSANIGNKAVQYGIRSSMTECWTDSNTYLMLHQELKTSRNSAWQLALISSLRGYYDINPSTGQITLRPKAKYIRQYYKYIRAGARRIDAASGNTNFDPLAFINKDGKYVIVVKSISGGSFSVNNLPASTYGIYYTTGPNGLTVTNSNVNLADQTISSGQTLITTIPGTGVITIYDKTGSTIPTSTPTASLTISPSSITTGSSATLSWSTTNATTVSIDQGIGAVAASGTKSISPTTNTTYTLSAINSAGTVTSLATLTVNNVATLSSLPLVTPATLRYEGGFSLPYFGGANCRFGYGGPGLTYNPNRNSLYLSGHDDLCPKVAEVSIPTPLVTNNYNDLPAATMLQSFGDVTDGKVTLSALGLRIGGMLVHNNRLITSTFVYYDASFSQQKSHFASGLDLSVTNDAVGPFDVGTLNIGFYSGYMTPIPSAWQSVLGGPALTGNCCLSIISRTSYGPSVSVFNPDDVGVVEPVPVTTLVAYPDNHQTLGPWGTAPDGTYGPGSDLFNGGTNIRAVAFPEGTRSVLFFGRQGTGPFCYGSKCFPGAGQGIHADPYRYQVWAYDAIELAKVKAGTKQYWEVTPYQYWELPLPNYGTGAFPTISGAGYDPATGRIYLFQDRGEQPVVQIFTIDLQSNLTLDTTPPIISNVQASNIGQFSADISWNTNEPSDSQVEYGTTTTYGSSTTINAALVSFHSATLSGLSANTLYHYRVKSRDATGNLATSPDASFTTKARSITVSGQDGSGAMVATLNRGTSVSAFYFGGTVSPFYWVTNRNYAKLDFSAAFDVAPGAGSAWIWSAEYATLSPGQNCADITNWNTVSLCTTSGTDKSCAANNVPVNIIGPACVRGRGVPSGTPLARKGGTASFHLYDSNSDGPMHFQGTGGATITSGVLYAGNWNTDTNHDRSYWISPGVALQSAGGVIAFVNPPGTGNTWNFKIAYSKTSLSTGQNCMDLTYDLTPNVCTISGATQKECHWAPVAVNVPAGGCVQIQGTWTGGTFMSVKPFNWGLDLSTSNTNPYNAGGPSYSDASSGAFDAGHTFGVGPWAIGDLNSILSPTGSDAVANQQYWLAPPTGLSACAGAFTFTSATTGTGQFDIGLRISTTAPTNSQSCLDLNYTDTVALGSMRVGEKSLSFPLTSVSIPGNACFALVVKTSNGMPTDTSPFNWQASCIVGTATSNIGDLNQDGKVDILDILIITKYFGKSSQLDARADVNKDAVIDILDIFIVVRNWS